MQLWRLAVHSAEWVSRLQAQGTSVFQFEGHQAEESSYLTESLLFALFRHSNDWMRLIYIMQGNCFTLSTDLNVDLIQKHTH